MKKLTQQFKFIQFLAFLAILNFNLQLLSDSQSIQQNNSQNSSRFDNEQEYICEETSVTKPAQHSSTHGKTNIISDVVTQATFSTEETRVLVTERTMNGKTTITTKICKTKNPSYLTWQNGALALTSAAALGIGAWAYNQGFDINSIIQQNKQTIAQPNISNAERYKDVHINNTQDFKDQAIWDAVATGNYNIDYNAFNKQTGQNIATGLTPAENSQFAPYAAGALALGAAPLAGAARGVASLTAKEIAKTTAKDSALFSGTDAIIHAAIAYKNNEDILTAAQHGAVNGVISGAGFGAGQAAGKTAGLGKYGQIGAGFVGATTVPQVYPNSIEEELNQILTQ